ncbi:MAG: type II toxin-antitoxin system RelE/ParE family toxin [Isosphaeraceae bacterium]
MSDPVILKKPAARVDLAGCYAYIGERNTDAARRFRLAAETTFTALARMPGIGAPYELANPRLRGLRSAQVRRFRNYLIFYLPVAGGIEVIRVLHAARNIRAILERERAD